MGSPLRRIPIEEYAAIDAVNWSVLKVLRDGAPLHFQHRLANPPPDRDVLRRGRAVHTAVLEPDRFPLDYAVWPKENGNRRGGKWDAFVEANEGRTIITEAQYRQCCGMRDAVRSNRDAMAHLARGIAEATVTWTDRNTGLRCKARLDWVSEAGALIDLKSVQSVEPGRFGRTVARYGYHAQVGLYADGLAEVTRRVSPVYFIAVEAEAPHDVGVFRVDQPEAEFDPLYAGAEEAHDLLRQVAECRQVGAWPGRHQGEQALQLPPWMFAADTDDEMGSGLDLLVNGHTDERSDGDAL